MKKIIAILLAAVMILGLAACGEKGPKPEDTVTAFCEAVKAFDFEAMQACVDEKIEEEDFISNEEEEAQELMDYLKKNASELTYKVGEASVDGDKATVAVDMEYTDISNVMKEVFSEYLTQMLALMFEGGSEEEAAAVLDDVLSEKIASVETTRASENIVFNLVKKDEAWKITESNDQIIKVMTGNMEAGIEAVGDMFSEEDGWTEAPETVVYPISNEVLFDNEYGRMTILSGNDEGYGYFNFDVLCENKTSDKTLNFSVSEAAVNGWSTNIYYEEAVAPGEQTTSTMNIYDFAIDTIPIEAPDKLELGVRLYDYDDPWGEEVYLVDDIYTVYPTGKTEAQITVPARPSDDDEMVVADSDDLTFIIVDEVEESYWGYELMLYIQNKTDKTLNYSWENVTINGQSVEPYWGLDVHPGRQALSSAAVSTEDIEALGISIDDIEEVGFTLSVTDPDDWDADPIISENFIYRP